MNRLYRMIIPLLAILIFIFIPQTSIAIEASSITLDKGYIILMIGEETKITPQISPSNANNNIEWKSADNNIVSVDQYGNVKGLSLGRTKVTAKTNNGKKASSLIRVVEPSIAVTDIKLDKSKITMEEGEEVTIDATISPSDATNQTIIWRSSNNNAFEVKNGRIIAKHVGKGIVIAISSNGKWASCQVEVKEPKVEATKIELTETSLTLTKGVSKSLVAIVTPARASNRTITWSSSNPDIAEVDDNGKITTKNIGTTIIKATLPNGLSASCNVTVKLIEVTNITIVQKNSTLAVGKTLQLEVTFEPLYASDKSITWSSSDPSIATVSDTGLVRALKTGNVTITAKSHNNKTATCTIRINNPATKITLDKTSIKLKVGETQTLKATLEPKDATSTISWSTTDNRIADVKDGKITAKKNGTVTITATTSNGKKATCKVTVVKNDVKVTKIELNKNKLSLAKGQSETLTVKFTPTDATNKSLSWKSSNTSVAEVKDGKVTAKKAGSATITATSNNGKKDTCKVTVKDTLEVKSIKLNKDKLTLTKGKSATLTVQFTPSNASNKNITWKSSDTSIAEVKNGKVIAKKVGSAKITATSNNGKKATCKVTVKNSTIAVTSIKLNKDKLTLAKGKSATLTVQFTPSNATNKTITWSSNKTSVAEVKNGKVTAKKAGTATITATSSNGKKATCKVTVKETIAVTSITLKQKDCTVPLGTKLQLNATISPSNATNKTITWSSSDSKIAKVSSTGLVTGLKTGKVTITAKTANNKKATCIIRVNIPAKSISFEKSTYTMNKGDTLKLKVTFNPTNTTGKSLTYKSFDTSIATVNSSGVVTAKKTGTTTIQATTIYGKTAKCTIKVVENTNTIYVAKNGNNSNSGKSPAKPVKTIKEGISKLKAGYTLMVAAGTYNETDLKISKVGTSSNPIKIVANGKVIIDGGGKKKILTIDNAKYVTIDGFTFQNLKKLDAKGIYIKPDSKYITIANCTFKNIKTTNSSSEDGGASAIFLDGNSTSAIEHITIKNCTLHNIVSGYSECISVDGNCAYIDITGVKITSDSGVRTNIGICICGNYKTCSKSSLDRPRHCTISNCTVSHCKSDYKDGFAYGIYVDGGEDIKIFNNTVKNCEGGIEVGAEKHSSSFSGRETENVKAYNNTIKSCKIGAQIGGWDGSGTTKNITFDSNSFTDCGHDGGKVIEFSKCNHVTISNNTFDKKESKCYENSSMAKDVNKKNNKYAK